MPKNEKEGIHLLKTSASLNYAPAENKLGDLYRHGHFVTQNYALAYVWYHKAATQGYVPAENNLAHAYYTSSESPVNSDAKADYWWKKAAAAGDPEAEFSLGYDYANGYGEKKSYSKADFWLLKAATYAINDHKYSRFNSKFYWVGMTIDRLCRDYRNGGFGIDKSIEKEIYWRKIGVKLQSSWSDYRLGKHYEKGIGVPQNYKKAVYLWRLSIKNGGIGNSSSEYELGKAYLFGHGVAENISLAEYWLKKSGNVPGAKKLIQFIDNKQ